MRVYSYLIPELSHRGIAYTQMVEPGTQSDLYQEGGQQTARLRELFDGGYFANAGYGCDTAIRVANSGQADLVACGRPYIANPDLAERPEIDAELNDGDQSTYYGGGVEGYLDYPTLEEQKAA